MKLQYGLAIAAFLAACEGTTDGDTNDTDVVDVTVPTSYAFTSREGSVSSVAYDGQTMRHVLINDLNKHIGGLTARLNSGFFPLPGEVRGELEFFFDFDSETSGSIAHLTTTTPTALQSTYDDISSDKDIVGKMAGNDPSTDHTNWNTNFVGWGAEGSTTPEQLVRSWFDMIDRQATDWSNGTYPLDPSGAPVAAVYLTAEGLDLQQLIGKVSGVSVSFSQGVDDYLDDDIDGKGILSDHSALVDGKPYTALEHQWDEAFGYFGASRDFGTRSDDEIADTPAIDADNDGRIDLESEMSFGHSGNAAKRDRGSKVEIDLTAMAWRGFAGGRQLLADTNGALSDAELDALRAYRDEAVTAWEASIAATALHYINDTLRDMEAIGAAEYSFSNHAKHWGELKGFAIGLQFNRNSPLSAANFSLFHELVGDAPVLADADQATRDSYAADLRQARQLLLDVYGFDPANLGDDNGHDGW